MIKKGQKGFTIVELLGVIVLLALIAIIAVPSVANMLKETTIAYYTTNENTLELGAKDYYSANRGLLPKKYGETSMVDIEQLVSSGYIDPIVDKKNKSCTGYVIVYKEETENYKYHTCVICDDYQTKGQYCSEEYYPENNYIIESPKDATHILNTPFTLPLAQVKRKSTGEILVHDLAPVKNTVDITKVGSYTLEYTYKIAKGKTIITVVDPTKPILTISPKEVTITQGDSYDVMTGVSASDFDSGIDTVYADITNTTILPIGTHIITYTAKDKSGNITVDTRTIIVEPSIPDKPSVILRLGSSMGATYQEGTWTKESIYQEFTSNGRVNYYEYTTNPSGTWTKGNNLLQVNEGNYTIYVRGVNDKGVGEAISYTMKIDKTPPVINFSEHSPSVWSATSKNATVTIIDSLSGVASKKWDESTKAASHFQSSGKVISTDVVNFNRYRVTIYAKDNVGNETTLVKTVKVDRFKPVTPYFNVTKSNATFPEWHNTMTCTPPLNILSYEAMTCNVTATYYGSSTNFKHNHYITYTDQYDCEVESCSPSVLEVKMTCENDGFRDWHEYGTSGSCEYKMNTTATRYYRIRNAAGTYSSVNTIHIKYRYG